MDQKRIFIITQTDESQNYGVGRYILEIASEIERRKIDYTLVVVTMAVSGLIAPEKKVSYNITNLFIPCPFFREGSNETLTSQYSKAVFCILSDFFTITETDIFHFNNPRHYYLLTQVKRLTSAKILYTLHASLWKIFYNNDFKDFQKAWSNKEDTTQIKRTIAAEVKNCELADRVICLSDEIVKDVVETYLIPKNKIKKIANGIQLVDGANTIKESMALKNRLKITSSDFVFLYVGRFNEQKGVHQLLSVFSEILKHKTINVKLVLVGDGALLPLLRKRHKHFKNKILFTGYINPKEVGLYYRIADCLVFPSLNEQSSYVMLEAMAHKLPMIVTDIRAFDVLEDMKTCLRIGIKKQNRVDEVDLKMKMKKMMNERVLREQIAHNAYELYLKKFTVTQMFVATYSTL